MNWRRRLVAVIVLIHALGVTLSPGHARAQTTLPAAMVISQLQAGGVGSGHADEEFIELYNAGAMPLSLGHWLIQYRSAGNVGDCTAGWSTKVTLADNVIVPAHSYWLAAANGFLATVDSRFSAGLPGTKGTLRLVSSDGGLSDALAWGGSPCGMGLPSVAVPDGQSLERRPGASQLSSGNGTNSGDNLADFSVRNVPLPRGHATPPEPMMTAVYPVIELSEVSFGPQAAITLHNPTAESVQVSAYSLTVGDVTYYLAPASLAADGYLTFSAAAVKLVYQPGGGSVMLSDPAGDTDDEVAWSQGSDASKYARVDGGWGWTGVLPEALAAEAPAPIALPQLLITELLVNPAAPLRDGVDEFVEIYNDGDESIDLAGYVLRSGSSLGNKAVLDHIVIAPGAYLALAAAITHLPLANSGGRVALFDAQGVAVGSEVSYLKAPLGQAYAWFADGWKWTLLPTPGADNILAAPAVVTPVAKVATAKKSSASKTAVAKAKTAAKPKAPKIKAAAFTTAVMAPSGRWLLFVLGGLTMTYIGYEFRYNLQHSYYRCRRYFSARRTPRPPAAGPDGSGASQ